MNQLLLWSDARIPDEYKQHFRAHGDCLNCGHPLRHHMHAYNHWLACHTVKVPPHDPNRYFIWRRQAQAWFEVDKDLFDACKRDGFAWAVAKPPVKKTAKRRRTAYPPAA